MAKFCTSCGARLIENSVFCIACGTRVIDDAQPVNQAAQAPQPANPPQYQQQTNQPQYQHPTYAPQYQQPTNPPQYQQPANPPQYQQPANPPQYQQPTYAPQYQQQADPQQKKSSPGLTLLAIILAILLAAQCVAAGLWYPGFFRSLSGDPVPTSEPYHSSAVSD